MRDRSYEDGYIALGFKPVISDKKKNRGKKNFGHTAVNQLYNELIAVEVVDQQHRTTELEQTVRKIVDRHGNEIWPENGTRDHLRCVDQNSPYRQHLKYPSNKERLVKLVVQWKHAIMEQARRNAEQKARSGSRVEAKKSLQPGVPGSSIAAQSYGNTGAQVRNSGLHGVHTARTSSTQTLSSSPPPSFGPMTRDATERRSSQEFAQKLFKDLSVEKLYTIRRDENDRVFYPSGLKQFDDRLPDHQAVNENIGKLDATCRVDDVDYTFKIERTRPGQGQSPIWIARFEQPLNVPVSFCCFLYRTGPQLPLMSKPEVVTFAIWQSTRKISTYDVKVHVNISGAVTNGGPVGPSTVCSPHPRVDTVPAVLEYGHINGRSNESEPPWRISASGEGPTVDDISCGHEDPLSAHSLNPTTPDAAEVNEPVSNSNLIESPTYSNVVRGDGLDTGFRHERDSSSWNTDDILHDTGNGGTLFGIDLYGSNEVQRAAMEANNAQRTFSQPSDFASHRGGDGDATSDQAADGPAQQVPSRDLDHHEASEHREEPFAGSRLQTNRKGKGAMFAGLPNQRGELSTQDGPGQSSIPTSADVRPDVEGNEATANREHRAMESTIASGPSNMRAAVRGGLNDTAERPEDRLLPFEGCECHPGYYNEKYWPRQNYQVDVLTCQYRCPYCGDEFETAPPVRTHLKHHKHDPLPGITVKRGKSGPAEMASDHPAQRYHIPGTVRRPKRTSGTARSDIYDVPDTPDGDDSYLLRRRRNNKRPRGDQQSTRAKKRVRSQPKKSAAQTVAPGAVHDISEERESVRLGSPIEVANQSPDVPAEAQPSGPEPRNAPPADSMPPPRLPSAKRAVTTDMPHMRNIRAHSMPVDGTGMRSSEVTPRLASAAASGGISSQAHQVAAPPAARSSLPNATNSGQAAPKTFPARFFVFRKAKDGHEYRTWQFMTIHERFSFHDILGEVSQELDTSQVQTIRLMRQCNEEVRREAPILNRDMSEENNFLTMGVALEMFEAAHQHCTFQGGRCFISVTFGYE